jgi:hypothetical protein
MFLNVWGECREIVVDIMRTLPIEKGDFDANA